MKSVMHNKEDGTCYLCMMLHSDYQRRVNLEEHHVFMGPNKKNSERYGIKVYLCHEHHTGSKEAVHVNYEVCRRLQAEGQKTFEMAYPNKSFIKVFGKNYLEHTSEQESISRK
ncbi:MAG: hypothetical protein J6I66_01820 [Lachnospiraceae bacterium]|nr:hypothetical protein [Lachnospiraceae bacterium]